jgi:hypothetical protein
MKIKFCKYCKCLCVKKIINNKLQLECGNCKTLDNQLDEDDMLLYDFNYKNDIMISNKLLKNIANDQISLTINKECFHCKKPFIKQYLSENYEKTINICQCLF